MDAKRVIKDFKKAKSKKNAWIKEAKEDFEFALGKQWKDEDVRTLEGLGVKALTINKIQPNLFLISGIQRQNRSDFRAYPEGEEDGVTADIASMLLKNSMKRTQGEYRLSEMFEDGAICGEGWVEPYIDYTYDLLNGDLRLKKVNPFNVFVDPASTEFDLSDAEYAIKLTPKLTEEQVLHLYPDKKRLLRRMADGRINLDSLGDIENLGSTHQTDDYEEDEFINDEGEIDAKLYDLVEYHYKKYVPTYYVADKKTSKLQKFKTKKEAESFVSAATANDENPDEPSAVFIERSIPEIWTCVVIGQTKIDDYRCDFYPRWKNFPLIPYYAHRITTPIDDREYMTQGIVRSLKDPQREINKRRTQELRHLNQSANSGWLSQEGAWADDTDVEGFGSAPGVDLNYKKGFDKPERITPTPLSQGHAQLVEENSQDMKEISGINADLLAMNESTTQSGRAIHLRQQQGIVMIQRMIDNFGQTKRLIADFILSQLGELYTTETAIRVCGNAFVKDNFEKPVLDERGMPVLDDRGELQMEVNEEDVIAIFNMVLTDTEVGKYDISVGEGANSETVRYANYMLLMELAEKGLPIPPDVLIEESLIASGSKEKIKKAVQQAMKEQEQAQREAPQDESGAK